VKMMTVMRSHTQKRSGVYPEGRFEPRLFYNSRPSVAHVRTRHTHTHTHVKERKKERISFAAGLSLSVCYTVDNGRLCIEKLSRSMCEREEEKKGQVEKVKPKRQQIM
jgi:hypothetical protein